jgi:hypothetical protein
MRQRSTMRFLPALERCEAIQLLSATSPATDGHDSKSDPRTPALQADAKTAADETAANVVTKGDRDATSGHRGKPASPGYLAFRVTNTPWQTPYELVPPFQQVLVQNNKPIPGQVYNVLSVAVKNGTAQTFTANNNFTVRLTNQPRSFKGFPILTGTQEWKPGQILVFYVLTKKYYPVSFVGGGFQFDLGGRSSTAIPGPAGIFLRLTYNPAKFAKTLNWIVAFGPGNEAGAGASLGLPNTSINQIVSATTQRSDFAGHF